MVRLNKYLADCGVASRRKCDALIAAGKVSVNGTIEQRLGTKIETGADIVKFNNKVVIPSAGSEYILLHKPKDVITTVADDRGRKTVMDLVRSRARLFPVGRLDRDTTGVLLLTNDGAMAHTLMHPRFNVSKTYEVNLNSELQHGDVLRLEAGIELDEGTTSETIVQFPTPLDRRFVVITIHQGWNRQIRRMFEQLGHRVVRLKRVGYAFLDVRGLRRGQWRHLTNIEVQRLRGLVKHAN